MPDQLPNIMKETLLDGVSATGAATASWASGARAHTFYVAISNTATVDIETSPDGVNWFTEQQLTATGIHRINAAASHMRVNVSAYTSGTVTVYHEAYTRN